MKTPAEIVAKAREGVDMIRDLDPALSATLDRAIEQYERAYPAPPPHRDGPPPFPKSPSQFAFEIGDYATKITGDYSFVGDIRARFTKRNGAIRYVVENDDGILHIFSESNLRRGAAVPR